VQIGHLLDQEQRSSQHLLAFLAVLQDSRIYFFVASLFDLRRSIKRISIRSTTPCFVSALSASCCSVSVSNANLTALQAMQAAVHEVGDVPCRACLKRRPEGLSVSIDLAPELHELHAFLHQVWVLPPGLHDIRPSRSDHDFVVDVDVELLCLRGCGAAPKVPLGQNKQRGKHAKQQTNKPQRINIPLTLYVAHRNLWPSGSRSTLHPVPSLADDVLDLAGIASNFS
jgi:hypothetical protein